MGTTSGTVEKLLGLGAPGHQPASAIAGVRNGSRTDVSAGGWAQLPGPDTPGVPMTRGTLLDLASVTKVASTTTLAMRLCADGQLALDSPVGRFLAGFRGDGRDDVTVEDLLTHTAGLQPWWPLYCETTDRVDAVELAQTLPLSSRPGSAWAYSDLGLILAGTVVERVTGLGLADAFHELVAEPLGLSATYGPVPPDRAAASADSDAYEFGMVATGVPYPVPFAPERFTGWRDQPIRGVVNDGNAAHALGGVSGHAGLFGTIDDLLGLGAALVAADLVPRPVLERFATASPVNPEQAVGFRRRTLELGDERLSLLHHGGFTGTFFGFALETELVVAGGAMRLYGTLGGLPSYDALPAPSDLVAGPDIQEILLDAALRVRTDSSPNPATLGDNR